MRKEKLVTIKSPFVLITFDYVAKKHLSAGYLTGVGFSVPDLLSLATHENVFQHQQLPQQMQISPYRNTKDQVKNAWQGPIPF